ncbi:MAG: hypothetical protein DRJ35_08280, partial [Thermoprotei archaeon]
HSLPAQPGRSAAGDAANGVRPDQRATDAAGAQCPPQRTVLPPEGRDVAAGGDAVWGGEVEVI